jgi:acyl-CoA thioesterase-1
MVRKLNFVALGDSLTVGFIPTRYANQPYSEFVKEYADHFLKELGRKNTIQIRITNRGVNGDLTSNMLLRFRQDVSNLKPDYVIILGGANDVGWGLPVEETFLNLQRLFEKALEETIKPVGCTVPSILGWDEGIPPRQKLNRLLKDYCSMKMIPCADLFASTCDPETKRLRFNYSSDGLHLNITGYRKIAETIFEQAVKALLIRELDKG